MQPAVLGDAVFAAAADGTVARLQAGRSVWKSSVDTPVSGGVGGNSRIIVVGSPKGEVIALDADSGKVKWRASVNAEILAAPVLSDAMVVVRSADSRLWS